MDLTGNLIAEIIAFTIFSMLPSLFLFVLNLKKKRNFTIVREEIAELFAPTAPVDLAGMATMDKTIGALRSRMVRMYQAKKISQDMLERLNGFLNQNIYAVRIQYLKKTFADFPELSEMVELISSDNRITQSELYNLINEIRNSETIPPQAKHSYISNLTNAFIKNNRVVETDELLSSAMGTRQGRWAFRVLLGGSIGLPILAGIGIIWYLQSSRKPTFVFGVKGFVNEESYLDIKEKLEAYLSDETGEVVELKYYRNNEDVSSLVADLDGNKLNGLMLNSGSYASLFKIRPDLLEQRLEVFCQQEENKKMSYSSAIITNRGRLARYCQEKHLDAKLFDPKTPLDDAKKRLIHDYLLCGPFTFTHVNSSSGFQLPQQYLYAAFGIVEKKDMNSEKGVMVHFSGNHAASIQGIVGNRYHAASVAYKTLVNKYRNNLDAIQVLYLSPEIPNNPYLVVKDLDERLKTKIINAFKKLDADVSEKGLRVKSNKLSITGWKTCTNEQYFLKIRPCLEMLSVKFPKPILEFKVQESLTEQKYKVPLAHMISLVKSQLARIGLFEQERLEQNSCVDYYRVDMHWYDDAFAKGRQKIGGEIFHDEKPIWKFELVPEELRETKPEGLEDSVASAVVHNTLNNVPLCYTIHYDQKDLFINFGSDDGFVDGILYLYPQMVEIARDFYRIESDRTIFQKEKIGDISRYIGQKVVVKYPEPKFR